ncbi:hypothetical protein SLUN_35785 [Streptomyces lunaelactis]|uniref:Uncharacterized protein n=1 Tax=Streptomyces lunaelactis TaxID=1535768 RepID=A0A2R4TCF3_9ACTN|nr:hypothetical protein [Streptomyces lunaelactis]AVZ76761.1 hypothetical protein SLUN_35785 [Streptomyces lunaelactis]NUK88823.1 hypothetical protein [Streptomyces lunaelactis]
MLGVVINGGDAAEPGTALLIAAAPVGKGRLIDASSVLPTLAAVPPSALTGTPAATVIELADPLDPQTVLTRIRAAATAEGPLSLYLAGQLQLDRKQRLLHLALARTTPTTMRYTALPWHWLAGELAIRRPGSTTVVVDLVADPEAWQHLGEAGLALGHGIRLFGRITPASPRRGAAAPAYLKACAEIWRSGARPDLATLHEQAAARAGGEESLLLAVGAVPPLGAPGGQALAAGMALPVAASAAQSTAPVGVPAAVAAGSSDPHPAILAAAQAGRHSEAAAAAAAWEQQELRIHGPGSVQAIHWLEVRADLARLAQDPALSCELWMSAAAARLTRRQAPDDPDVEGAVDRAHHQWEQIRDLPRARALAPVLVRLRRDVPGRQRGALQVLQRRLESLHAGRP